MKKIKIKKNDMVLVISGTSRGKQGKVIKVSLEKNRVFVEGVNMISKHTKPTNENPQGAILKQEASIHISNLMLLDPKTGERTRIGRKKDKKGKLIRFSKKSGEEIK